jgi:hypothetical protein
MPPIAIVTASPATRAIVTALNFFFARPQKTFDPRDRLAAFAHVGIRDVELANAVLERLIEMARGSGLTAQP